MCNNDELDEFKYCEGDVTDCNRCTGCSLQYEYEDIDEMDD